MDPIHHALTAFADRHPARRRYLVGVSGGRDSVALLDILHASGFSNLVVCHLNHRLRGRASGHDAAFVRRLAGRYGLPAEVAKIDVAKLASQIGVSLEDAGRRARLSFFARAAITWRCRRVILAHHADDQVETVLMNLGRGTGTGGLQGMKSESNVMAEPTAGVPDSGDGSATCGIGKIPLTLLRPLLGVWRQDLASYLEQRNLPHRDDPSNADPTHLRNRVRHQLIPQLEAIFQRDIKIPILRAATLRGDEDAFLNALASESLAASASYTPVSFPSVSPPIPLPTLVVAKIRDLPTALQRRVIYRWLTDFAVPDIGFREVEAIRALLLPNPLSAKVNLPRGTHARRKSGHLFLTIPDA